MTRLTAEPGKKVKRTNEAEDTLAYQLQTATRFAFKREYRACPPRLWRYDFLVGLPTGPSDRLMVLVDIDGGQWTGGHSRGVAFEPNVEKHNEATLRGFMVLRVTPKMVKDGRALQLIERALGG